MSPIEAQALPWALLLGAAALLGCDQASVTEQPELRAADPQRGALRALVPPSGIEAMYRRELTGGLSLQMPARQLDEPGASLQLGPLEQSLPLEDIELQAQASSAQITLALPTPQLTVPTRHGRGAQTVICRWQVRAEAAEVRAQLEVTSSEQGPVLAPTAPPEGALEQVRVDPVGACPIEALGQDPGGSGRPDEAALAELEAALARYVEDALVEATGQVLTRSPARAFGIIEGGLGLTRVSAFENRRGQLRVIGQPSPSDGLALDGRGATLEYDYSVRAPVAACAPPLPLPTPETIPAEPFDLEAITRQGADLAVALSEPLLSRLAAALTRAGFLCQGVETLGRSEQTLATRELLLESVGLEASMFGDRARLTMSPGALPVVRTRPADAALEVTWDDLSVEVYTEVLGTPTRALHLQADLVLSARLDPDGVGAMRLNVEAVDARGATLESDWQRQPPADDELDAWARRLLLILLDDQVTLPLPLAPGAPLSLIEARVRERDLVLLLELEGSP